LQRQEGPLQCIEAGRAEERPPVQLGCELEPHPELGALRPFVPHTMSQDDQASTASPRLMILGHKRVCQSDQTLCWGSAATFVHRLQMTNSRVSRRLKRVVLSPSRQPSDRFHGAAALFQLHRISLPSPTFFAIPSFAMPVVLEVIERVFHELPLLAHRRGKPPAPVDRPPEQGTVEVASRQTMIAKGCASS